jgi:hypothetical protein
MDGPRLTRALPLLFHSLPRMRRSVVVDGRVIWTGFRFLLPREIREMLVFVFADDFCQEAVFFARGGLCPIVRDVFQFGG